MTLLDRDIGKAKALVIDANATSRSVLSAQLRDLGVEHVKHSGRLADARAQLERSTYDIVLCDHHFAGSEMTGQDLLDDLRREQVLPWSTVFIMIASEATYAKVVEAAESALDSYLVKPYKASALAERLTQARLRKKVLADIFAALDRGDVDTAVRQCNARFFKRDTYWGFAGRLAAELEMQRQRPEAALTLFEAAHVAEGWHWARLGIARAQWAMGDVARARKTVELALNEDPGQPDAHDVMGRIQLEHGEMDRALGTFRVAAGLTPGCLLRLQQCATVAFQQGEADEAARMVERCITLGLRSKLFDARILLLLAFVHHDRGDPARLEAACEQLRHQSSRHVGSLRLHRMRQMAESLKALLQGKAGEAIAMARQVAGLASSPNLDDETVHDTIALMARISPEALSDADADALAAPLALRYCTSRGSTEMMAAYARARPSLVALVRRCHADVGKMAESAMAHSLQQRHDLAVRTLLQQGRDTGNAKLLEMARLVALRHAETIADSALLVAQADEVLESMCSAPVMGLAGQRRSRRTPGGLVMRQPAAA